MRAKKIKSKGAKKYGIIYFDKDRPATILNPAYFTWKQIEYLKSGNSVMFTVNSEVTYSDLFMK